MSSSLSAVTVRAFVSYARADDETFAFVDPFVKYLKALVKVKSGRDLDVFVDKEAIGWGEDWRSRLGEAVNGSLIFIPFITATYLDRPNCRDEFLAFLTKAESLGVTDLLLPIIPFRSPLINAESTDTIVTFTESRQHKVLEEGILGGYDSPQWKRVMADIASSLLAALSSAEATLAAGVTAAAAVADVHASSSTDSAALGEDFEDSLGVVEWISEMHSAVAEMTNFATDLGPTIAELGSAAEGLPDISEASSPQQYQIWAVRLADKFSQPSRKLHKTGLDLYGATERMGRAISALDQISREVEDQDLRSSITEGLGSLLNQFPDLEETEGSMQSLLDAMRTGEALSTAIRRALRPARAGITAIRDSLRMIRSWANASAPTSLD